MTVRLERSGERIDVVLDRPDVLNAMDFDTFDRLAEVAVEIERDSDARVVVVRGEGRAFSSGIDVSNLGSVAGDPAEMIARAQEGFRRFGELPVPSVAAVHGFAFGAGLQLALVCDLRVMTEGTQVGLLEANYGLIPDLGGSTLLPRLIGPAAAKKMIWLAERIDTPEALRLGLADLVVPQEDLEAAVEGLAKKLIDAPKTPVRESKALIDRAHLNDLGDGMDAEAVAQKRCMTSPEFGENLLRGLQQRGTS